MTAGPRRAPRTTYCSLAAVFCAVHIDGRPGDATGAVCARDGGRKSNAAKTFGKVGFRPPPNELLKERGEDEHRKQDAPAGQSARDDRTVKHSLPSRQYACSNLRPSFALRR